MSFKQIIQKELDEERFNPLEIYYEPQLGKLKSMTRNSSDKELRFIIGLKSGKLEAVGDSVTHYHDHLLPPEHRHGRDNLDEPSEGYPHIRGKLFYNGEKNQFKYAARSMIHRSDTYRFGPHDDIEVNHPVLDQLEKMGMKRDFVSSQWVRWSPKKKSKNSELKQIQSLYNSLKSNPTRISNLENISFENNKTLRQLLKESETEAEDTRPWKKVGERKGSNPGGVFQNEKGEEYYVKHSHTNDHAHNEILANRLYEKLGVPTLNPRLIRHSKGFGIASKMTPLKNFNIHNKTDVEDIRKHFGAHCLLSNWDAIGLEDDNQARTKNGKMTTVDAGGSLNYRAMGGPKGNAFGHKAGEWDTLRNPEKSQQASRVFGGMNHHELIDSVRPVAGLKNTDIHSLVHEHGPGEFKDKEEMTNKLVSRKKDLIFRANSLAQQHKLPLLKDIDE